VPLDGDAVEDGVLLSASELHRCGHFFYSPSDLVPISVPVDSDHQADDDLKDKTYWPPKNSNKLENEVPDAIFASDREELTSETERGHELVSRNQDKFFDSKVCC
jgi:hypothetical protein